MAQHDQLYQRALYYDIALAREVAPEVEFIDGVFRKHAGRAPESVLEVACGPGYHARALAARGYRVVGLDYSPGMIELAREHAAADGVDAEWLVADMRDFTLEDPVDAAICMFDGVDALTEDDDFVRHLRTVAAALAPDGVYVIDCTHPRICSYKDYGAYRYEGERDGTRVEIVWATNAPRIDPVTGVAEVGIEMRVERDGEAQVIRDRAHERCYTGPELRLLAERSGAFDIAGWYGDADLARPLRDTPDAERMIAVLRKRPSR